MPERAGFDTSTSSTRARLALKFALARPVSMASLTPLLATSMPSAILEVTLGSSRSVKPKRCKGHCWMIFQDCRARDE